MKDKVKGYQAGIPITFTPSRQAEWVDEFNDMLERENYSRNKLTELLVSVGMEAQRNNSSVEKVSENRTVAVDDSNLLTLPSDNFSQEQIELLKTGHYQSLIETFINQLFNATQSVEDEVLKGFLPNKQSLNAVSEIAATEKVEHLPQSTLPETIVTNNEELKSTELHVPLQENKTTKKADRSNALKFIRSIKE